MKGHHGQAADDAYKYGNRDVYLVEPREMFKMKHLSEGSRSRYILVALFDRHDCIPEDDDAKPLINRFRAFRQTYFVEPAEQLGDVDLPNKDDSDVKEKATESIASVPNLEEFQDRLDEISSRLARLERLIERMGPGIDEVSQSARVIREGFDFYNSMLQVMSKFTRAERLESRFKDLKKDEISWKIIQILDGSRPLNISQITASVRAERGSASRRIVRGRVKNLVERSILKVIKSEDDRARYYALTEDVAK